MTKALPHQRGFTNLFRIAYSGVNLDKLNRFPVDAQVTPQTLLESGILRNLKHPVKILGRGDVEVPLAVEAHRFSASARAKIEAAGGTATELA